MAALGGNFAEWGSCLSSVGSTESVFGLVVDEAILRLQSGAVRLAAVAAFAGALRSNV